MTGKGMITYANGDKYIGDFKNGLKHGTGTYQEASGMQYECIFDEDILISVPDHNNSN